MAGPARPQSSARRRFLIIRNRHAGLASARLVDRVANALERRHAILHIVTTESAGDVRRALAETGDIDAIVAAGGDGTVRSLALDLLDSNPSLPIGIIPAGTGNVLANDIGLSRNPDTIAEVLMSAPTRDVHIMQANGTPFLLMASAGYDAAVLTRLSHPVKQRIGRAAYTMPTMATLAAEHPRPFEVLLDGTSHEATWAIIANARTYGGSFTLAPEASIFEPTLVAVLFGARTRTGRLRELLHLAAGQCARCPGVRVLRCSRAILDAPANIQSQVDGDLLGKGRVEVAPMERTTRLITPPEAG